MRWRLKTKTGSLVEVELFEVQEGVYRFRVDGKEVILRQPLNFPYSLKTQELELSFENWSSHQWRAAQASKVWVVEPQGFGEASQIAQTILRSQMPGRIVDICVAEDQEFKKGDKLIIMEAMKMENEIRAEFNGRIKKIHVQKAQSVESNQVLLELEL